MNIGTNAHDESKRLVGSKYSELWDVLIDTPVDNLGQPNWGYNLLGCSTCGGYRVVVLTGDIDFNASDAAEPSGRGALGVRDALYGWVGRGGVLVMTASVLLTPGNNFSDLNISVGKRTSASVVGVQTADGAWVSRRPASQMQVFEPAHSSDNSTTPLLSLVTADGNRLPAVTQTKIGSGSVVVVHPPVAADLDALHVLDWLLTNITDGVTPFSFTGGSVQTLLNRRPSGWNLTIVNNEGVTKNCGINCCAPDWKEPHRCTPDIIDPSKAQEITVTLKPEHAKLLGDLQSSAVEHVMRTPVVLTGNSFVITVPSGATRIVGVNHA